MSTGDGALRIGVDIGGTFTDVVCVSDRGGVYEAKVPSRRNEPELALSDGLREVASLVGHETIESLLRKTDMIVQGTTIAINAVLQRNGAKTALLCTRGFRDTLEIRLGYKENRYDFAFIPPQALIPRELRIPITERVDKRGTELMGLDEDEVRRAVLSCQERGVEAIAISFLWSFLNEDHEKRTEEIVRAALPDVFVTRSTSVLPVMREYNRTSTTALNAYVGPRVAGYVERTENFLREMGFEGRIRYVQSNGGLAESAEVQRRPVLLLVSGPAAAPAAGLHFSRLAGRNFITMDMGGTSFDVCLVRDGLPDIRAATDVDGQRVATPLIDVQTIGAGGGSIAVLEEGLLRVGPQSAEAYPGPAAYMRGGTRPTVTDANVSAGLLNSTHLLAGTFPISSAAAATALREEIADAADLTLEDAAAGVLEVVNRNMADAMREITIRRGHDPRDYSLVVGGGAGGSHAAQLAAELGIETVVIPRIASAFCAFGAIVADLRHDYTVSYMSEMKQAEIATLRAILERYEQTAEKTLREEGVSPDDIRFLRSLDLRYKNQVFEVTVDVTDVDLTGEAGSIRNEIESRFHREHERLYQFSQPGYTCELITLRVTGFGKNAPVTFDATVAQPGAEPRPRERRLVHFDRTVRCDDVPVYDGAVFSEDAVFDGPAIVEEPHTTIAIPIGWRGRFSSADQAYVLEQVGAAP